jgi:hypothetical protein
VGGGVRAIAGWASLFDPYWDLLRGHRRNILRRAAPADQAQRSFVAPRSTGRVDAPIVGVLAVIAFIAWSGGTDLHVLHQTIGLRSYYNPVFALTCLMVVRGYVRYRPTIAIRPAAARAAARFVLVAGIAGVIVLAPLLIALGYSYADGAALHGPNYWRSTPPGIDLLALFTPNPNHALFGAPWHWWLASRPNRFEENVAALTLVGIGVVAAAVWRYRFRPPRIWVVLTVSLAALALGPFVHVGGVNTFVPGPWALLRFVPIVTATRMPARYAIPMMMSFSVLFALALRCITAAHEGRRRVIIAAVAACLIFELNPYPRTLHAAHVPAVLSGCDVVSANERLRCYRYERGQRFARRATSTPRRSSTRPIIRNR